MTSASRLVTPHPARPDNPTRDVLVECFRAGGCLTAPGRGHLLEKKSANPVILDVRGRNEGEEEKMMKMRPTLNFPTPKPSGVPHRSSPPHAFLDLLIALVVAVIVAALFLSL